MKVVYISFPLYNNKERDKEKADKYSKYVLEQRFLPITPNIIIQQLERICNDKKQFLNKRLELVKRCDELWAFQKEIKANMIDEIHIAKVHNIPIRYIDYSNEINTVNQSYEYEKSLQLLRLSKYKKWLKKVNNLLYSVYSDEIHCQEMNCSNIELDVELDENLSDSQKKYLIRKIQACSLTDYLDNGYRYIWNLNNNLRNFRLYTRTMYYIKSLEMGEKKFCLMKKMFNFVKHDKSILPHKKDCCIETLFYEIEKQSRLEKHPESYLLGQIYMRKDIYDLVEVFLGD